MNTSGTLAAEVSGTGQDGRRLDVHLSTPLPAGLDRGAAGGRSDRVLDAATRREDRAARGRVGEPSHAVCRLTIVRVRLWVAQVTVPAPLPAYLSTHGRPIRYGYVRGELADQRLPERLRDRAWFCRDAERRPALHAQRSSRASSPRGVGVTPLLLHTGVASLEAGRARLTPSSTGCRAPRPGESTTPAGTAVA